MTNLGAGNIQLRYRGGQGGPTSGLLLAPTAGGGSKGPPEWSFSTDHVAQWVTDGLPIEFLITFQGGAIDGDAIGRLMVSQQGNALPADEDGEALPADGQGYVQVVTIQAGGRSRVFSVMLT
ncbi:hypothetical protein [Caulobacter segnis]|uniref:hypothetical protein n=1 Tax=Caulobacter segnis TaxID=88688 RepID=UPI001CBFEB0E|nr:hypothetical protein [Caulobacter segnis]UAL10218.1 hypothetical protein K8940_21010 [Caulobacter segnis]